jgi:hypothetical protein
LEKLTIAREKRFVICWTGKRDDRRPKAEDRSCLAKPDPALRERRKTEDRLREVKSFR